MSWGLISCKSGNSINRSVTIDGNNFIDLLLSMLSHSFACQNKNLFHAIERYAVYIKKITLKLSCNLSHKHKNSFTSHDSFYELWNWDKKSIKVSLNASRWENFVAWRWKKCITFIFSGDLNGKSLCVRIAHIKSLIRIYIYVVHTHISEIIITTKILFNERKKLILKIKNWQLI